jgi:hypothetical protein
MLLLVSWQWHKQERIECLTNRNHTIIMCLEQVSLGLAKYVHAHVLCKWFNSITFVSYRAQKLNKYSLIRNLVYVLNNKLFLFQCFRKGQILFRKKQPLIFPNSSLKLISSICLFNSFLEIMTKDWASSFSFYMRDHCMKSASYE